jgi:hypothetical protein
MEMLLSVNGLCRYADFRRHAKNWRHSQPNGMTERRYGRGEEVVKRRGGFKTRFKFQRFFGVAKKFLPCERHLLY